MPTIKINSLLQIFFIKQQQLSLSRNCLTLSFHSRLPAFQCLFYRWSPLQLLYYLMSQRKAWTKQEDQLLISIMTEAATLEPSRRLKWNEIAAKISQLSNAKTRKGKQCRERWFNQLHPKIKREAEWTAEEERALFRLQGELGNKWAHIAREIPGRSDNNIKNYFYSTLRKALRRVNNYVTSHKQLPIYKNIKAFQANTLNKVLTVAENKADRKIIVGKQNATQLAKDIRDALIQLQTSSVESQNNERDDFMGRLIAKIQDFNRGCKRRKSKKKESSSCEQREQEDSFIEDQQTPHLSITPLLQNKSHFNTITSLRDNDHKSPKIPLRCSSAEAEQKAALGFKQVESEPLVLPKNVRQPIIPALHSSNCLSLQPQDPLPKAKDSQSLQHSGQTQPDQSIQPIASNLNFIPYLQHNYYTGSAFMPTAFYQRPYCSFTSTDNASAPYSYPLVWSQDYSKREEAQNNPFLSGQNALQGEKGEKEE